MNNPTVLSVAALLLAAACGIGGGDSPAIENGDAGAGESTSEGPEMVQEQITNDEQRDLAIAVGFPRVIAVNAYLSRALIVEAVYQATALSGSSFYGQVTNTGTLTTEYGNLQYLPQPTDRLVLRWGQETQEFVVRDVQGNMQAQTAASWLLYPHILRYRHVLPGQADVEMSVQYDGMSFQSEVTGWYEQSGQRYDLNLMASGQSQTQRGIDGQEAATEYDFTGTISREGFTLDVSEHHTSSLAAAMHPTRQLPGQRGSASRFNGTINNVLRSGDVEYKLENVHVQTDMVERRGEGSAGLTDFGGQILRNGRLLGQCVLQSGQAFLDTGSARIPLDLPPKG